MVSYQISTILTTAYKLIKSFYFVPFTWVEHWVNRWPLKSSSSMSNLVTGPCNHLVHQHATPTKANPHDHYVRSKKDCVRRGLPVWSIQTPRGVVLFVLMSYNCFRLSFKCKRPVFKSVFSLLSFSLSRSLLSVSLFTFFSLQITLGISV